MKILFVGYHNPNFITITEYIEKAIERLGHTLISFDDRQFIIPGRIRKEVSFLQNRDLSGINKKLLSLITSHIPDLCLVAGGHRIFPQTVKKIKEKKIKTILWTIDAPRNFQPIIEAASYYDFVFCGGTEAIEVLRNAGIKKSHWLPFACDPHIHKPIQLSPEEKQKYGNDIIFVGSFYPNRVNVLEELTDFDLGIWGPGWQKIPSSSPLKKHVRRSGGIKPDEWVKIYSSCKIAVMIHYQDGEIPCYQASPRVYETLSCKCFLIADNQRDAASLFDDGTHLVIFKDIRELREKIKHYLEHPEEREKLVEAGYREVTEKHTYYHRIKKMLHIVKEGD